MKRIILPFALCSVAMMFSCKGQNQPAVEQTPVAVEAVEIVAADTVGNMVATDTTVVVAVEEAK